MEQSVRGVGYEGQDIVTFVQAQALASSSIRTVVDVRLTPISRKKGFSKRALAAHLSRAGIDYVHLSALGNPQWNRAGFSEPPGGLERARQTCRELYAQEDALAALNEICALSRRGPVALLCFEADEDRCHRAVVLDAVRERLSTLAYSV